MEKNRTSSLLMFISSMLIFGTVGIARKSIPVSSAMLSCVRGLIGSAFLVLFVKLRKKPIRHNIGWKKLGMLVLIGICIGLNWILLFEAYNYTTVATATLCYYKQPTIVVFLSPLFLKEKLTPKRLLCALVSVVGMVFVSGIVENGMPTLGEAKGILYGLSAAALYATVIILNKKNPGVDAYEKTIVQLFSAALVMVPYLLIFEDVTAVQLDSKSIWMLLLVGLVHTGFAYTLYFAGMDGLRAQSVAVFSYLDPIAALILSALILKESMTVWGIIGAVLIIGAALVSELQFKKKGRLA